MEKVKREWLTPTRMLCLVWFTLGWVLHSCFIDLVGLIY
jgi:hypothetical protein